MKSKKDTMKTALLLTGLMALPASPLHAQKAGGSPASGNPILVGTDVNQVSVSTTARPVSQKRAPDVVLGVLLDDDQQPGKPAKDGKEPTEIELRYYTPRGHLYETRLVPIGTGSEKERKIDGYPNPVAVAAVQKHGLNGKVWGRVDVTLPVAGTTISSFGLYGVWRVEAWQNGVAIAKATFTVTE